MRIGPWLGLLVLIGATPAPAGEGVPVIYGTDLYHPHIDADDHLDLATLFALPELDVRAILLDHGATQQKQPGCIPVSQMRRLTGRDVPSAIGLLPLKAPNDTGTDQPAEFQGAVELLLRTLKEADRPVTIITAGSVRDVQAAFNRDPSLFRSKVLQIYVNIGNSDTGGDEYNVDLDRAAYRGLMSSGLPITWYPCFPATGRATTYFRFVRCQEAFGAAPGPLRNFLIYALRRLDPGLQDPLASLDADLGTSDEALAQAPSFRGGKEMWCTPSFLDAAGRTCYQVGGRYVAASAPPPGGVRVTAYELVPTRLDLDERGKPTRVAPGVPEANVRMILRADPTLYSAVMNDCLHDLFDRFPVTELTRAGRLPEDSRQPQPVRAGVP